MNQFYITHRDQNGELHQISGAWDAETPEEAIVQMLQESGGDDDGEWEAHPVSAPSDVIA